MYTYIHINTQTYSKVYFKKLISKAYSELSPPDSKHLKCLTREFHLKFKMPLQLRKLCNQPDLFVAGKSECLFVIVICLT